MSFLKKKAVQLKQNLQDKYEHNETRKQERKELRQNLDKQIAIDEDKAYAKAYTMRKQQIATQRATAQGTKDASGLSLGMKLTAPLNKTNAKKVGNSATAGLNFLTGDMGLGGFGMNSGGKGTVEAVNDIFSFGPNKAAKPATTVNKTIIKSGNKTIIIKKKSAPQAQQPTTIQNIEKLMEF